MSIEVPGGISWSRRVAIHLLLGSACLGFALLVARHHALAAADLLMLTATTGVLHWLARRGEDQAAVAGSAERLSIHTSGAKPEIELTLDESTGIAGPTALAAKLKEEWRRTRRPGEPTALLLIQMDRVQTDRANGLSQVAGEKPRTDAAVDERAELAWRVLLLTLARALARMLPRSSDLLARYDETTFAVVLPGTDLPGALRVAARLRFSVLRMGIANDLAESGILTVSTGVAVQHGLMPDGPTTLMTAAASALQRAVDHGCDGLEYAVLEGSDALPAGQDPVMAQAPLEWAPAMGSTVHASQS